MAEEIVCRKITLYYIAPPQKKLFFKTVNSVLRINPNTHGQLSLRLTTGCPNKHGNSVTNLISSF